MAQILKLKDASAPWRKLITALRTEPQEGIVKDEKDQTVAVVLPVERYESYQAYLRQREEDFAVLDGIDEDLKGYDPDFIEAQIEKALVEVKAESKEKRLAGR